MTPPPQTSLTLLFPELEPVVGDFRMRLDPSAQYGFPPHNTILWPFLLPDEVDDPTLEKLERFFQGFPAFDLQFHRVRASSGSIYLVPEPPETIIAMIRGIIRLYPDNPPYSNPDWDPVPHVTLAYGKSREELENLAADFEEKAGSLLPVATRVTQAWLLDFRGDRWTDRHAFPLG